MTSVTSPQILTSTKGQTGLPRYFGAAYATISRLQRGRLDFRLPDGRTFRAEGKTPGPAALVDVVNPELFARLIREGDLGFCEAYLDGWWTTPDLQSFLDLMQEGNEAVYDSIPGLGLVRALERFRFGLQSNSKTQAKKNIT